MNGQTDVANIGQGRAAAMDPDTDPHLEIVGADAVESTAASSASCADSPESHPQASLGPLLPGSRRYFGAIRIAPSRRITSPLSISFSKMCRTSAPRPMNARSTSQTTRV